LSENLQGNPVSFGELIELTTEMLRFIENVLGEDKSDGDEIFEEDLPEIQPESGTSRHDAVSGSYTQMTQREYAYSLLREATEILIDDDPHSPVPYIVTEAVNLGQLRTPQLYEELFVKRKGNLNLFELMGLED